MGQISKLFDIILLSYMLAMLIITRRMLYMHFGASVIEFAGCQRVVLDAPLSPVQSRPLTCAAGCQRVILDAPLSPVQSRPISRGRHVSLPSRYHNIGCVKVT